MTERQLLLLIKDLADIVAFGLDDIEPHKAQAIEEDALARANEALQQLEDS